MIEDYKNNLIDYLNERLQSNIPFYFDRLEKELSTFKKICVFGIGNISASIVEAINANTKIKIDFLCDNDKNKWGKIYFGNLKCISPKELEQYKDDVGIILTTIHFDEIKKQLNLLGFKNIYLLPAYKIFNAPFFNNKHNYPSILTGINRLYEILGDAESERIVNIFVKNWFDCDYFGEGYKVIYSGNQYFPKDIITLSKNENFVDVGAFDGDTLVEFFKTTEYCFDSVHAFELDKNIFNLLNNRISKLAIEHQNKIFLHNIGLYNANKDIAFSSGFSNSQITNTETKVDVETGVVKKMDDVLQNEKVTFIKMDIEGAEPYALQGAENIIKSQKPKLAICVYHKPEHLWEIPLYIKKLVPEYKIYIRHHTLLDYETVCYATI